MPRLALVVCLVWFVSLFLFRTIVQWRTTGSSGVKGFHGRVGSLPWIAGVSASLGLALAPIAPIAAIFGWPGGALLFVGPELHVAGLVLALVGIAGALLAQLAMGSSWRVGVDESERTELVTGGLFAWVRNPIFTFISLSAFGLALLVPNVLALLAGASTLLGIELQVRAVEEPYLLRTHGTEYARYAARVGRFVPAIGRLRGDDLSSGVTSG
jgi:protein-S-isoprenylcysteine O-methyltransferase Ste14